MIHFSPRRHRHIFFYNSLLYTSIFCMMPLLVCGQSELISDNDWPWWRGPQRNGIANPNQDPPSTWDETNNVTWKTPLPGKGHGGITILGQQVILATADLDRDVQSVICLDRKTGERTWESIIHRGGLKTKGNQKQNKKASLASTTVATDGKLLFVNFLNQESVWTTAISLQGKFVWQEKICDYIVHQGFGSSPSIINGLVIVSADNKGGGMIKALRADNGKLVWEKSRPRKPNYSSPIILNVGGKDQLLMTGCDQVTSIDPTSGKLLWEIPGATTECVTSSVTDGKHIFTSGGYPKNHLAAVVADGSGKIAWENNSRHYVPSLVHSGGYLFGVMDAGIAVCYDSRTGETQWKNRLQGDFSSSLVLVGNRCYATNEKGETFIFSANPKQFSLIAKNKLGDSSLSTATICGSRVYMRVAHSESDQRQEYVYCLGKQ